MAQKLLGEIEERLTRLGLPPDRCDAVMTMVRQRLAQEPSDEPAETQPLDVAVARATYKTAVRAATALGSSSFSTLIMLLDLFVAHEQDRRISVTSLCIASGAASTTALRQIGQLEDRGFITRHEDDHDRRRCWVRPTPRAIELIRSLVDELTAVLCA